MRARLPKKPCFRSRFERSRYWALHPRSIAASCAARRRPQGVRRRLMLRGGESCAEPAVAGGWFCQRHRFVAGSWFRRLPSSPSSLGPIESAKRSATHLHSLTQAMPRSPFESAPRQRRAAGKGASRERHVGARRVARAPWCSSHGNRLGRRAPECLPARALARLLSLRALPGS